MNAVRAAIVHTEIHARGGEPGRVACVKNSMPSRRAEYGGVAE